MVVMENNINEIPDYYNKSKPVADKKEKLSGRHCNVCGKKTMMTRFQRFCQSCRVYVAKRYGDI